MVKNRVLKNHARKIKSDTGIPYPRALASITDSKHLHITLGTDSKGSNIIWPHKGRITNLSVQGPSGSGKSTLLANLAVQASSHADVYVCMPSSADLPSEISAYASDIDGTIDVLMAVRSSLKAVLKQAGAFEVSMLPNDENPNSLKARMIRQNVTTKVLPVNQRPRPTVVIIDNFDALCRVWSWENKDPITQPGPEALVAELARDGHRAGISVVISGESLSPERGTGLATGGRLLLGPATLPERESFLDSDVVDMHVKLGSALYELPGGDAVRVFLTSADHVWGSDGAVLMPEDFVKMTGDDLEEWPVLFEPETMAKVLTNDEGIWAKIIADDGRFIRASLANSPIGGFAEFGDRVVFKREHVRDIISPDQG